MITFHHTNLDFEKIKSRIGEIEKTTFPISDSNSVSLSFLRTDRSAVIPTYQIAAITEDGSYFDEDLFLEAVRSAYLEVQQYTEEDSNLLQGDSYGYTELVSEERGKIRLGESVQKKLTSHSLVQVTL